MTALNIKMYYLYNVQIKYHSTKQDLKKVPTGFLPAGGNFLCMLRFAGRLGIHHFSWPSPSSSKLCRGKTGVPGGGGALEAQSPL